MKFSFKKIGSVLASGAMLTSTVALAAAANFPAPFVSSSGADVAIVHGGNKAMYTDLAAVADVTSFLSTELARVTASGSTTSGGTVTGGEAYALFSGSERLYLNDSLNKVRGLVTDSHLANALIDNTFEGDQTSDVTQKIQISNNPQLQFGTHPTSDDDPVFAVKTGVTGNTHIYNFSATFSKAVNLTHSDSTGEGLTLFGTPLTVGADTSTTKIVFLKASETLTITNDDPSREITINGESYTIELVGASDTSATIKVTDSDGNSQTKEVAEDKAKTIEGLSVSVTAADESNFALSATLSVGSDKITLQEGSAVKIGTNDDTIDGTNVRFIGGGYPGNITEIVIQVASEDSDTDAIISGGSFLDPVFGGVKIEFSGSNIEEDSTAREEIIIKPSGNDRASVEFQSHDASTSKVIEWYNNKSVDSRLADGGSSGGDIINVFERAKINKSEYVVVGNEDTGGLWELKTVSNDTSDVSKSTVRFQNVFTGEQKDAIISSTATGEIILNDKTYTVSYHDDRSLSDEEFVQLRYQDGSRGTANNAVIYPTIQTSKGAKFAFYEPIKINITDWDGTGDQGANLTALKFPDGDGYTSVTVGAHNVVNSTSFNVTCGSTVTQLGNLGDVNTVTNVGCAIGQLTYNLTASADREMTVKLNAVTGGAAINEPALIIFEEQDDSSSQTYEALIVKMEGAGDSNNKVGVSDVETTWGNDGRYDEVQMQSDTDLYKSMDYWGTISTTDQSTSDAYSATISYPDEQVYAQVYFAETEATISAGSTSGAGSVTSLGSIGVTDSEASSVAGKNLIVVGGSCVNTVAADLLGVSSPTCSADFTAATGVGSGQYLIETFARTGDKVATLVAGYDARDTTNGAKALTTQTIDTTAGQKYTGSTSTDVSMVVSGTTA
jgi:hypothetical protein